MLPLVLPFPDIDPALFTLSLGSFEFSLRWYALAYIVGLVVGWRLMVWLMRRPVLWPGQKAPMTTEQPEALLTWMVLGVILGGRVGYVLFYQPGYFVENPMAIIAVWEGGMSFHGGFLGVIVATILFTRMHKIPLLQAGDAVALAAPFGILLGRLANFINGELYGRATDVAWAIQFPTHNADGSRNWDALTEPRHPSQLYEAGLEGLLLFAVMWWLAVRAGWLKRPGRLIGVFFMGYGAARAFVENFRQGDPQFVSAANPNGQYWRFGEGADAFGLTMGQILSLPMVAIGIGFLLVAWRHRPA
ncbi:MAG: prolipoprotein diacylglyceryl transferase [Pseudomonadota bacterium]